MEPLKKKTPRDTTEFEREQLRFFLSQGDVSQTLAEINPSLAWLSELSRMKVIQSPRQLVPWIERNFEDTDAVREVAANLDYVDEATAALLEFRLNRRLKKLDPLLAKSWQLIIRHIRNARRGMLSSEWFELEPRLKAGEQTSEVLEKLANVLRPEPRIGRHFSWHDESTDESPPKRPSDLMSIDFEIQDGVTEAEVLGVWSKDAALGTEQRLLNILADALNSALEDAISAEVENNERFSISDTDVPSVAAHTQNEYRTGFLPIVRVIAEIWTHLADKDIVSALPFVQRWSNSPLKLNRRLALFAAANKAVPAAEAANVLLALPQGLLFFTGATVEVFRLILARWNDFPEQKRAEIEDRITAGPPRDWISSEVDMVVDRARYDLLGEMRRAGLKLGQSAESIFETIQSQHPIWVLRPPEQAGFHIWRGGGSWIQGDSQKFQNVSDASLVDEAKKIIDKADFLEGDHWQALCQSDAQRALRGLEAKASEGQWPAWAWNPFLWAAQKLDDSDGVSVAADLLLKFPKEDFAKIADTASWWLNEKARALDESRLWPLWDKIEAATAAQATETQNA